MSRGYWDRILEANLDTGDQNDPVPEIAVNTVNGHWHVGRLQSFDDDVVVMSTLSGRVSDFKLRHATAHVDRSTICAIEVRHELSEEEVQALMDQIELADGNEQR